VIIGWMFAVRSLNKQFVTLTGKTPAEEPKTQEKAPTAAAAAS